ncbi:MAG TPA: N-acetylmannosamine-6-phosphate 2-epimerase [Bacteroidota bacterium]|nr:N-acetylmannosamine-6-phosphate 2-epimerase [Bacteroidota bacterium]
MNNSVEKLKHGVIVLCHSEGDEPFNFPDYVAAFARAAEMGGAIGIRAQGIENIKSVRQAVGLPIIGISRGKYTDGWALVTPEVSDAERLVDVGADIVALDVTQRIRPNGMSGFEFLSLVRKRINVPIVADISTLEEGVRAAELGADMIATTLSGYTQYTEALVDNFPDFNLIEQLTAEIRTPVIAEGRIWSPSEAAHAIKCGAYAVVVGSAITRPRIITQRFAEVLKNL